MQWTLLRAPIANESEREHFQRRLALMLLLVFALAFGFWLVSVGIHPFLGHGSIAVLYTGTSSEAQLATTFSALGGALAVRGRKWEKNALDVFDLVTTLALCWGWAFMISVAIPEGRSELVGVLAVSYTLMLRAALLPSPTLRTGVIGLFGFAPLVPATLHLYGASGLDTYMNAPLGPAVYVAIWSALGIACTTTISAVIHGLRLEVSKAMQLGQYVLEHKIGEGAMGAVYRARHSMLRRPTAIKLLTGTSKHAATRFEREVQLTAALTHPNTIAVFDYGRTPDGVFYYAMEYLEGITLDDLVEQYGPQCPERVVNVLLQVCGALEEAHAAGLVHRDIKPANVMLTQRGGHLDTVKVLDFGLVKENDGGAALSTSSINAVMGTPHFMAPEAILDPPSVDGRTDLYALGVTAYFLLTGKRVFDGANLVEICSAHLHEVPPPLADVPGDLADIVLACLAKKPEERPRDAAALMVMLQGCSVKPWSCKDAAAWWETATAKPLPTEKRKGRQRVDLTGETVTIALGGRAS